VPNALSGPLTTQAHRVAPEADRVGVARAARIIGVVRLATGVVIPTEGVAATADQPPEQVPVVGDGGTGQAFGP